MIFFATFALILVQVVSFAQSAYYETGQIHGGSSGVDSGDIVCPLGGAFTGLTYRSSNVLHQIAFICTSSLGTHVIGPYGTAGNVNKGTVGTLSCPPGQYISNFYGGSGSRLDRLGIRCRPQNDVKSIGTDAGFVGGSGGTPFDEHALSQGYRIMSVKLRFGYDIDAMQATYGNTKISGDLCTTCTQYTEEWAPMHGGLGGEFSTTTVVCPAEGVITGIKYRYGSRLDSITFICTSAIGITECGPFGGNGGSAGEEKCPPGSYISSMHGRSGTEIDTLGIQCRKVGDSLSDGKRDPHGLGGGGPFDDNSYTTNQRRPVQIRIGYSDRINSIQVKYGNLPVSMNCKVSKIEVTDKTIVARSDGFAVIGLATGSTCSSETQNLQISQAATVEETTGVETSEGGEVNWSTTLSLEYSYGVEVLGVSSQISVGLSQSVGGSKSWSSTKQKSTTTSSTSTVGTQVNYKGPGACVLIGTMKRYKVERDNLPVLYHYQCEGGVSTPQQGTIKLLSTTFDQANFLDFAHTFKTPDECSQGARQCVSSLQAGKSISDPWNVKRDFDKCFK